MKQLSLILLLFCVLVQAHAQSDSAAFAALDGKLDEYLAAIEREPAEVKCSETDFLVSSCQDSSVRQRVANHIYRHYLESRVMGDEAVAIHVFDKWFDSALVSMDSEAQFYEAQFHARLNRPSLIGCKAQQLDLYNPDGEPVSIFGDDATGGWRIAYFYDVDCPNCMVETILLRNLLEARNYRVQLYAIYVGSDGPEWKKYREERLKINADKVTVSHFWDPELASGFAMKYAVVGTPRMFLVNPRGVIVGRGLDSSSLLQLLDALLTPKTIEYGDDAAMDMYSKVFDGMEEPDCDSVGKVAAQLKTDLLDAGDTLTYKQMTGNLLYFLTNRKEAAYKCGIGAFVDEYILGAEDVWNTADDSLKVVSLADFLKTLTSLCPLGSKLPQLEVPAIVKTPRREKTSLVRLDKVGKAVVMFYSKGCSLCRKEIEASDALLSSGDGENRVRKVVMIDMDEIWSSSGTLAEDLMKYFDLSSLPQIISTDSHARVTGKYLSLQ